MHVCQWRIAIISLVQLHIDIPCASILMFLQVMTTYMFCAAFKQVYFSIIHLQRAAQTIQNIAIEISN